MKNKKNILIIIQWVIIIVLLIITLFLMLNKEKTQVIGGKQSSLEKMTDSSRITELEKQIDSLNAEHTTYGQYIQTSKGKIATAITNGGVSTSADASADTMATNIATLATNRYNAGVTDGKKSAGAHIINIGSTTDIKSYITNNKLDVDYTTLTSNNFFIKPSALNWERLWSDGNVGSYVPGLKSISMSYNASTGTLTKNFYTSEYATAWGKTLDVRISLVGDIYLVY